MKIYMVCDDWVGKIEFFVTKELAQQRCIDRYNEFISSEHPGDPQVDDFYIEEYELLSELP